MSDVPPYRLPKSIKPSRYDITIKPDHIAQTFTGEVIITVDIAEPTNSITLNAAELTLSEARIAVRDGEQTASTIDVDTEAQTATMTFPEVCARGTATLHIAFSGAYNKNLCGIYPSTYTDSNEAKHTITTTHFEATDARRAFPCWDEPECKAVFAITLIIDRDLSAYSNAPILEEREMGDNKKRVRFADSMKMSTYLVAFVVGKLVESHTVLSDETPMRVVSVPGREHLHDYALDVCDASLRYYANYFEIPYPGAKMDMIALPDFAMGAMENLGCVTYRETALLVDPARASRPEIERVTEVIAHENAHMWFGDLVTMRWWNGIWLNEAFATFMAAMFACDFRPEWETWTSEALSRNAAMNVDSMSSTRPIEYEVVHPDDARGMFDLLTYEKGCAVLRMLEQHLTPEVFRKGIAAYLKDNAYDNTENSDLWDALETSSGEPVRALMDSWIFQGGYPILHASLAKNGTTLRITQKRFRYLQDDDAPSVWHVPVSVRACIDGEVKHFKQILVETTGEISLGGTPEWLVINENMSGYYRVAYDDTLREKLVVKLSALHPIERVSLVSDGWASCLAGDSDLASFLSLFEALAHDDDPNVWTTFIGALRLIEKTLDETTLEQFHAYVRRLTYPKFSELGWTRIDGESPHAPRLRSALVATLGTLGADPEIIAACESRYNSFMLDHGTLDPDVVEAVESVLATTNDVKWFDHFVQKFENPSNTPQEQMGALFSLAWFSDMELTHRLLQMIEQEKIRAQDAPFVVRLLLARHNNPNVIWDWCEKNWDMMSERYAESAIPRLVDGATGQLDEAFIDRVLAFLTTHPVPQAQKTVDQTCERLRVNKAFLQRNRGVTLSLFDSK